MHSDIKSGNVLLSKDLDSAKICDVGLARIMGNATLSSSGHSMPTTYAYAAPEILLCAKYVLLLVDMCLMCADSHVDI